MVLNLSGRLGCDFDELLQNVFWMQDGQGDYFLSVSVVKMKKDPQHLHIQGSSGVSFSSSDWFPLRSVEISFCFRHSEIGIKESFQ